MALGHCVCNPKKPCPCNTLIEKDLCPCAGERPDPPKEAIRLTQHVRKAGCGSKISRADLKRVLKDLPTTDDPNVLVGFPAGDDAGIYRLDGEYNLVQTVDVFSPVVDDPYTFGQIGAANSVSDVYAMGGKPICALSIIGFPIEELPSEVMTEILQGGIDKMTEAGVSVIGGHSINDEEVKCGFAVSGLIKGMGAVKNDGAKAGDWLVLTKPIGVGLLSFASQLGVASEEAGRLIAESMATLNKDAAEQMLRFGAHACTDVTGFSLLGHLSEIALHSGVSARIELADVPVFAEALGCARREMIPGAVERNRESFADGVVLVGEGEEVLVDLLYDAQTSGGLLVALEAERAQHFIESMHQLGHEATSKVGEIVEQQDYVIQVAAGEPRKMVGPYRLPEAPKSLAEEPCCEFPPESACCEIEEKSPTQAREAFPQKQKESSMDRQVTETAQTFKNFMRSVSGAGTLSVRTKRLLAIALSISERCEPCLKMHISGALKDGITPDEIDEIAWIAISFCGAPAKMFYEEIKNNLERG